MERQHRGHSTPCAEETPCERCGDAVDDVNVESWETTGQFLCEGCAAEAFEEDQ